VSYRKEDHYPAPIRNCKTCGREFEAQSWDHRICTECQETQEGKGEENMKTYKCDGCNVEYETGGLWVCEDDKLRCRACFDKHRDKLSICWDVLYGLGQEDDINLLEARALADARTFVSKRLALLNDKDEKAAVPGEVHDGSLTTDQPTG
jgi:hypothetical protein